MTETADPARVALAARLRVAADEIDLAGDRLTRGLSVVVREAAEALASHVAAPPATGDANFCVGDQHVWVADGHFAPVPIGKSCACGAVVWPPVAAPPEGTLTREQAETRLDENELARVCRVAMEHGIPAAHRAVLAALFPHDGSR